jgi:hypothetical protein
MSFFDTPTPFPKDSMLKNGIIQKILYFPCENFALSERCFYENFNIFTNNLILCQSGQGKYGIPKIGGIFKSAQLPNELVGGRSKRGSTEVKESCTPSVSFR